jgi:hypothetical protein
MGKHVEPAKLGHRFAKHRLVRPHVSEVYHLRHVAVGVAQLVARRLETVDEAEPRPDSVERPRDLPPDSSSRARHEDAFALEAGAEAPGVAHRTLANLELLTRSVREQGRRVSLSQSALRSCGVTTTS